MSEKILTGIRTGIDKVGIRVGINAFSTPTYIFDFSKPSAQSFVGYADSGQNHVWGFQESSGNVLDLVGSSDLVPEGSPLQGQAAAIWNGTDWTSRKAVESVVDNSVEGFALVSTSTLELSTSLAFEVTFRCLTGTPGLRTIFEKRTNGFGAGYELRISASGQLAASIEDDTTGSHTTTLTGPYDDGAWHRCRVVIDLVNDVLTVESDLDARSSTAITLSGSYVTTEPFEVLGAGQRKAPGNFQVTQLEAWTGTEAVARDSADLGWTLGADPTSLLTTATHASLASFTVNDTAGEIVSHWSGDGTHGQDQIPFRLMPDGDGMGIACWSSSTNLLSYSEDISGNWTDSGSVVTTANDADCPDGTRRATLIEGTTSADEVDITETITASIDHCASAWLKLKSSSSATIRMRIRDASSVVKTEDLTVTDEWVRYDFTWTHSANTTMIFLIYAGDGVSVNEDLHIWGAQVVVGINPLPYARSLGASSVSSGQSYRSTDKMSIGIGGMITTWSFDFVPSATSTITDILGGSPDRRQLTLNAVGSPGFTFRDSAGSVVDILVSSVSTAKSKQVSTYSWDKDAGISGVSGYMDNNGSSDTGGASFTIGTQDDLAIGSQSGVADLAPIHGAISRIEMYDIVVSA